jgi:hypothetical protein
LNSASESFSILDGFLDVTLPALTALRRGLRGSTRLRFVGVSSFCEEGRTEKNSFIVVRFGMLEE